MNTFESRLRPLTLRELNAWCDDDKLNVNHPLHCYKLIKYLNSSELNSGIEEGFCDAYVIKQKEMLVLEIPNYSLNGKKPKLYIEPLYNFSDFEPIIGLYANPDSEEIIKIKEYLENN